MEAGKLKITRNTMKNDEYAELDLEQTATVPSALPLIAYGTAYQPTLSLHSGWQLSRNG